MKKITLAVLGLALFVGVQSCSEDEEPNVVSTTMIDTTSSAQNNSDTVGNVSPTSVDSEIGDLQSDEETQEGVSNENVKDEIDQGILEGVWEQTGGVPTGLDLIKFDNNILYVAADGFLDDQYGFSVSDDTIHILDAESVPYTLDIERKVLSIFFEPEGASDYTYKGGKEIWNSLVKIEGDSGENTSGFDFSGVWKMEGASPAAYLYFYESFYYFVSAGVLIDGGVYAADSKYIDVDADFDWPYTVIDDNNLKIQTRAEMDPLDFNKVGGEEKWKELFPNGIQ